MSLQSAEQPYSSGSTPHLSIGVAAVLKWTLQVGKAWGRLNNARLV